MIKITKMRVFELVMINLLVVDNIRTLSLGAKYGLSLIIYYLLAAICFFIPTALVAAELSSNFPISGGIYIWIKEAFGKPVAFVTIWIQWFYNIIWYPTILSLVASLFISILPIHLIYQKLYLISTILICFWSMSLLNLCKLKYTSLISNLAAIIGTLIPMLFIIILGIIWFFSNQKIAITLDLNHLWPNLSHSNNLVFFVGIIFAYVGIEMPASHASEVINPQKNYPRALFYSVILILSTLILASLAIAIVIPADHLNLIIGFMQAFKQFLHYFHLDFLMIPLTLMIIIGALGSTSVWIIGPAKGLLIASKDGCLPKFFSKSIKEHIPINIIFVQAIIVSFLCLIFIYSPSIIDSFWLLTAMSAILSMCIYLIMFLAAIKLRYSKKRYCENNTFKIPGGKIVLIIICILGISTVLFAIITGLLPPTQLVISNVVHYEIILISGLIISILTPLIIYFTRPLQN